MSWQGHICVFVHRHKRTMVDVHNDVTAGTEQIDFNPPVIITYIINCTTCNLPHMLTVGDNDYLIDDLESRPSK